MEIVRPFLLFVLRKINSSCCSFICVLILGPLSCLIQYRESRSLPLPVLTSLIAFSLSQKEEGTDLKTFTSYRALPATASLRVNNNCRKPASRRSAACLHHDARLRAASCLQRQPASGIDRSRNAQCVHPRAGNSPP